MDQIRIALVDMPRMLRDVVANVLSGPEDLTIVGVYEDFAALDGPEVIQDADVIVFGSNSPTLDVPGRDLLARRPRVTLLSISPDGNDASLYGYRPFREHLGVLESVDLVSAIRRASVPEEW